MTVTLGWLDWRRDWLAAWCCCDPLCGVTSYDNSSNNITNKCTINCHVMEALLCPGRAQMPMIFEDIGPAALQDVVQVSIYNSPDQNGVWVAV